MLEQRQGGRRVVKRLKIEKPGTKKSKELKEV